MGSTTSLIIIYNVENLGETAYLTQMRITLPHTAIHYTKIPSNCKLDESAANIMECDLNNGLPLFRGGKTSLKIGIDTTELDGRELVVLAHVFSTGDELNELDNIDEKVIPLRKFSSLEIFG